MKMVKAKKHNICMLSKPIFKRACKVQFFDLTPATTSVEDRIERDPKNCSSGLLQCVANKRKRRNKPQENAGNYMEGPQGEEEEVAKGNNIVKDPLSGWNNMEVKRTRKQLLDVDSEASTP